jgi:beta-fructofuranosidase
VSTPELPRPDYPVINDPARPAWHFGPPAQWMNDPNGVSWHAGWWHVFYQHNPHGDVWADMHWGHARSRDLLHWEHLPLALRPQHADGENHCYSGCTAFTASGDARILYTSVPPDATRPASQVMATPRDPNWHTWTQHVTAPILDLATHGGPAFARDWRDPFVFRHEGRTFLILGAVLGEETVIPLYENPAGDLQHWLYRGIIYREPRTQTPFLECPNLICCGDHWLLLTSPCRAVEWHSGTLDLERYVFHRRSRGRVDESADYYATQPALDPHGRVVLFGWVRNFPAQRGWNGCLAVPRRVWLDAAGDFCSEPVAEIAALRTAETSLPAHSLSANPLTLTLPAASGCDGQLTLLRSPAATIQVELASLRIAIGPDGVRFGDRAAVQLAGTTELQLRWLLDASLLEIFVNDRVTCTQVVSYPVFPTVRLSVSGGEARLRHGRVWTLRPTPSTLA